MSPPINKCPNCGQETQDDQCTWCGHPVIERRSRGKKFHFILALTLSLIFSSGFFVYTWTSANVTIGANPCEGDLGGCEPVDEEDQPDWDLVLPDGDDGDGGDDGDEELDQSSTDCCEDGGGGEEILDQSNTDCCEGGGGECEEELDQENFGPPDGCSAITFIELEYTGSGTVDVDVYLKDTYLNTYTVSTGETFTVEATEATDWKLHSEINLEIEAVEVASIHTSCSQPIAIGDLHGDFVIVDLTKIPEDWHEFYGDKYIAQSFVAGLTGDLTRITLLLKKKDTPEPLIVEIRDVVAQDDYYVPGSTVLASIESSAVTSTAGQVYQFTFPSPASVTAGAHYTIVLYQKNDGGDSHKKYSWPRTTDDSYLAGTSIISNNGGTSWARSSPGDDQYFITYITATGDCGNNCDQGILQSWQRSAQTFVPVNNGTITRVSAYLEKINSPGTLTLQIRNTTGGSYAPGSTVLASVETSAVTATTSQWYDFTFTSPAAVTAGTHYALVLIEEVGVGDTNDQYLWGESESNPYASGNGWESTTNPESWSERDGGDSDLCFKIYVTTGGGGSACNWGIIQDSNRLAQTFVSGFSGNLTKVSAYLEKLNSPGTLTVQIRNTTGGSYAPGSTVLASVETSAVTSTTSQWYDFTFTSPATVTAGTHYSLVLIEEVGVGDTNDQYLWGESESNPYTGGNGWQSTTDPESWSGRGRGDSDFCFRTYVTGGDNGGGEECGEVPTGDLMEISCNECYPGDVQVDIYLTNVAALSKAYQYLNMKLYLEGSVEAGETPNYRLLTMENGVVRFNIEDCAAGAGPSQHTWTQTSQSDFESGTSYQVDTGTYPGDVILEQTSATNTVTDTYDDETMIASRTNLVVTGGQVKLTTGYASGTESLRPNAPGDETSILYQYPASGSHWDKVDDTTADDWSTHVYTGSTSYQRDLYNITDSGIGSGTINNVTVYYRFASDNDDDVGPAGGVYAIAYEGHDNDGYVKTVQIADNGQITHSVIDSLEFDPSTDHVEPSIIHVAGNIFAIAYEGDNNDGFLKTIEIADNGQITDTIIDTMEFDSKDGEYPDIIHITGNIYAITYMGDKSDGFLKTVEIATNGQITDTVIDSLEFDSKQGAFPEIIHVYGNIYAIAYQGNNEDGWLKTVEIAADGQITDSVIDSLEFDSGHCARPKIIHIADNVYAITYQDGNTDGYVKTVEIATSGQITNSVIDTVEFNTSNGGHPDIVHISANIYAIAHEGHDNDGWLKTVGIAPDGQITDSVIDSLEFDAGNGEDPDIVHIAGNVYAIAYQNGTEDAFLKTVEITANGQITDTVIDTYEFEPIYGLNPDMIVVSSYGGGSDTVYAQPVIKTHSTVYTGTEQSTDSDTFITESYQWATNPFTGSAWTWSEIDALQAGIELKVDDSDDYAACTQVYVVVDYEGGGYNSPGTLVSINLLSGETVTCIGEFDYIASAIPSGTTLKVQFSQDSTTWHNSSGTPGGWDTMSQGTHSIDLSVLGWTGANFYYRIVFTSDGSDTPVLDEISLDYCSGYYTSGTLTSSAHDAGCDNPTYGTISFTVSEPASTDIKFQVRSAATEAGLSSATWYGPTGTSDYYQTSGTAINSVHNGDRWIQYKVYLSSPGTSTPVLSDVSITYTCPGGGASSYTLSIIGGSYCLVSDDPDEWAEGWTIIPEFYCEVKQR